MRPARATHGDPVTNKTELLLLPDELTPLFLYIALLVLGSISSPQVFFIGEDDVGCFPVLFMI